MQRHAVARLDELSLRLSGSVVTIGVFDGMHLGHQAIMSRVTAAAAARKLPSVCVTFSVHPKAVLAGRAPEQILSLEHRLERIEAAGLDHAVVLQFSKDLAAIEPETFVEQLLVRRLGVRELVIGHDTAIGKGRRGDAGFLADAGLRYGFGVVAIGEVSVDGETISSTALRRAIGAGGLAKARRMLGRPPSLLGQVVHGDGRGATIGFPTANLEVHSEAFPPLGVYAVIARCEAGDLPAVMNYGMRPTFHQDARHAVFEIHILDRDDLELYGQRMEVFLEGYIRRERRFDGVEALTEQIAKDIEAARKALVRAAPLPER